MVARRGVPLLRADGALGAPRPCRRTTRPQPAARLAIVSACRRSWWPRGWRSWPGRRCGRRRSWTTGRCSSRPLSRAADFGIGTGLAVVAAAGVRLGRRARIARRGHRSDRPGRLVATRPFVLVGEWWHPAYALAIAVALTAIVLHDGPWPARPRGRHAGVDRRARLRDLPDPRAGHAGARQPGAAARAAARDEGSWSRPCSSPYPPCCWPGSARGPWRRPGPSGWPPSTASGNAARLLPARRRQPG